MVRSNSIFGTDSSAPTQESRHEKNVDNLLHARTIVSTRYRVIEARTAFKLLEANYHEKRLTLIENHEKENEKVKENEKENTQHKNTQEILESDPESVSKRKLAERLAAKKMKNMPKEPSPIGRERGREKERALDKALLSLDAENVLSVQTLLDTLQKEFKIKDLKEDLIREKWIEKLTEINVEEEIENLRKESVAEIIILEQKIDNFTLKYRENCDTEKRFKKNQIENNSMKLKLKAKNVKIKNKSERSEKSEENSDFECTELLTREIESLQKSCDEMLQNDKKTFEEEKSEISKILALPLSWGPPLDYRSLQNLLHQKILERTYCEGGTYLHFC